MLRAIWRILLFAVVLSATAGVATLIAGAFVGAAGLGTLEYQTVGSIVQAAAALVTTCVAFGLLHTPNPGATVQSVVLVTLAGIFLATIRIATDSLYAAWAAHFAWNWVMAALFHAPVSGYAFDAPGYRYVDAG